MKSFVVLVLALCFAHAGWSQQRPAVIGGFQQQLSLHRLIFRLGASPYIGVQQKRSTANIGPLFLLREFPDATHEGIKLTGAQVSYQYLLSAENKKWRLYADFIAKGQVFNESWQSNSWDEAGQLYVDHSQKSREMMWEGYAGLGVRYQLHPCLYLQGSGTLGYSISQLKYAAGSPANPAPYYDYRPYEDRDLAYAINLGLFFKLKE